MSETNIRVQHYFFLGLVVVTGLILLLTFWPFLTPLILGAALAVVFRPIHRKIVKFAGNRQNLGTALTIILVLVIVLIPLVLVGGLLFNEAKTLYVSLSYGGSSNALNTVITSLERNLRVISPDITLDAGAYIEGGLRWMLSHLDSFFSGFFGILMGAIIMIVGMFFFLRDGSMLREKLMILSPLDRNLDEDLISKVTRAIKAVIKGTIFISLIQGLFAGIGFWIAGIPNPVIWGTAAAISSLIPAVGTSLVTVPAIIFLFVTAPIWHAVGLLVWAVFGIGLIDNFLSPFVIERGIKIHPFLILLSVLGGIVFFGPVGFLMGPVTLAFFFALLEMYPLIINKKT